jgi:hypothetical protein
MDSRQRHAQAPPHGGGGGEGTGKRQSSEELAGRTRSPHPACPASDQRLTTSPRPEGKGVAAQQTDRTRRCEAVSKRCRKQQSKDPTAHRRLRPAVSEQARSRGGSYPGRQRARTPTRQQSPKRPPPPKTSPSREQAAAVHPAPDLGRLPSPALAHYSGAAPGRAMTTRGLAFKHAPVARPIRTGWRPQRSQGPRSRGT